MNNNSLINNIYINILYVENRFLKGNGLKKSLEKFGDKNLIESLPHPPTKYTMSLASVKQVHVAAKQLCLVFGNGSG